MRQRQPVRHRAVDGPAGRGAGRRDRQRDLKRNLAVIFETAEHRRPAGAQQFGGADLLDDAWEQVAVALGLFGEGPDLRRQRLRPRDQFVGARDRQSADHGAAHLKRIPSPQFGRGCRDRPYSGAPSGGNEVGSVSLNGSAAICEAFEILSGGRRSRTARRHHRNPLPIESRPFQIAPQRPDVAALQQSRDRFRARA